MLRLLAFLLSVLLVSGASADDWADAVSALAARLREEKVPEAQLVPLDPARRQFVERAVELKLLDILRPKASFGDFTGPGSVSRVAGFVRKHRPAFRRAFRRYGVEPTVVASILWIETKYGEYPPSYVALDTLTSLAALSVPAFGKEWADEGRRRAKKKYPKGQVLDWPGRVRWVGETWFTQLRAFLELIDRLGWNPEEVKSSWAGAMGYGQFMPVTALENLARGKLHKADLWNWDDTIDMVSREFHRQGWRSGLSEKKQFNVVRRYNYHKEYARQTLVLSRRAFKRMQPSPAPPESPKAVDAAVGPVEGGRLKGVGDSKRDEILGDGAGDLHETGRPEEIGADPLDRGETKSGSGDDAVELVPPPAEGGQVPPAETPTPAGGEAAPDSDQTP